MTTEIPVSSIFSMVTVTPAGIERAKTLVADEHARKKFFEDKKCAMNFLEVLAATSPEGRTTVSDILTATNNEKEGNTISLLISDGYGPRVFKLLGFPNDISIEQAVEILIQDDILDTAIRHDVKEISEFPFRPDLSVQQMVQMFSLPFVIQTLCEKGRATAIMTDVMHRASVTTEHKAHMFAALRAGEGIVRAGFGKALLDFVRQQDVTDEQRVAVLSNPYTVSSLTSLGFGRDILDIVEGYQTTPLQQVRILQTHETARAFSNQSVDESVRSRYLSITATPHYMQASKNYRRVELDRYFRVVRTPATLEAVAS